PRSGAETHASPSRSTPACSRPTANPTSAIFVTAGTGIIHSGMTIALLWRSSRNGALWLDLDSDGTERAAGYDVVIQNLRLITKTRKNVWAANDRRWSEVAL